MEVSFFPDLNNINDVDLDRVMTPDKFACGKKGFKYFTCY